MLPSLEIFGFRGFRRLRIDTLARVNLFVGTNNAGKTSILEAAELVVKGDMQGLRRGPRRRGEWARIEEERVRGDRSFLDISHLFHGHILKVGSSFEISSGPDLWVRCKVIESDLASEEQEPGLRVQFSSSSEKSRLFSPFLRETVVFPMPLRPDPVQFLCTDVVLASELGDLWDEVVLTPEEDGVLEAIRIVDPNIERIAFLGEGDASRSILLKPKGAEQRVPLGSAGDGLKRLLALALHLFSAKDGYLLVDEIDTGLHHTVMVDMWKLVIETARRLGVQVLATTHSLDCVRALAWVQEENPEMRSEVMLHRIEPGLPSTVRYTMDELAIAAEHHLEVR